MDNLKDDDLLDELGLAEKERPRENQPKSENVINNNTIFGSDTLGDGIRWDTCQPAQTINVQISFVQTCTFSMSLFGKTIQ